MPSSAVKEDFPMFFANQPTQRHQQSTGDYLNNFLNQVLAFVLKLFVGVLAAVFAVSLLLAGLVYLAFASIRFLFTGKKPAVAVVFSQLRQYRQSAADGVWPAPGRRPQPKRAPTPDVVDVEVREVDDERRADDDGRHR
jgi:hypothetical protein